MDKKELGYATLFILWGVAWTKEILDYVIFGFLLALVSPAGLAAITVGTTLSSVLKIVGLSGGITDILDLPLYLFIALLIAPAILSLFTYVIFWAVAAMSEGAISRTEMFIGVCVALFEAIPFISHVFPAWTIFLYYLSTGKLKGLKKAKPLSNNKVGI